MIFAVTEFDGSSNLPEVSPRRRNQTHFRKALASHVSEAAVRIIKNKKQHISFDLNFLLISVRDFIPFQV